MPNHLRPLTFFSIAVAESLRTKRKKT